MRKNTFKRIQILALLIISQTNFQCKKDINSSFCEIQRTTVNSVLNKDGIIGYYVKYKKWAIYANVDTPNNIDSKIVAITCDLPKQLQNDGEKIIFSGVYKEFNPDEKILPQLGGEELYYINVTKIEKK